MRLKSIFFLFFIFISHLSAKNTASQTKTICLNMIVKDESQVIKRSLASVKNIIDYWVIVDTGSTDETKNIIKECLKDIPGELHERPWVNFEYNRNEALSLAKNKGNYLLFIDADEQLDSSEALKTISLDKDFYFISVHQSYTDFHRIFLINNALKWSWQGVLHEELISTEAKNFEILDGVSLLATFQDGHRTQDPEKHLKDAQILEAAIQKDPENRRYVSFLAQTYLVAKDYQSALKNFKKRISMGGCEEETFWALYQIGCLQELLDHPHEEIVDSYCKAYAFRPSRAEPIFQLAYRFYKSKNYVLGYTLSKLALSIPYPTNDSIYVIRPIYDYQLRLLMANCAHQLGKFEEAISSYKTILSTKNLPETVRQETTHCLLKEPPL